MHPSPLFNSAQKFRTAKARNKKPVSKRNTYGVQPEVDYEDNNDVPEPAAKRPKRANSKFATKSATESATKTATGVATESATEATPESAPESAPELSTKSSTKSSAKLSTKSLTKSGLDSSQRPRRVCHQHQINYNESDDDVEFLGTGCLDFVSLECWNL